MVFFFIIFLYTEEIRVDISVRVCLQKTVLGVISFRHVEGKELLKLVFRELFVKCAAYLFEPINKSLEKKQGSNFFF